MQLETVVVKTGPRLVLGANCHADSEMAEAMACHIKIKIVEAGGRKKEDVEF